MDLNSAKEVMMDLVILTSLEHKVKISITPKDQSYVRRERVRTTKPLKW